MKKCIFLIGMTLIFFTLNAQTQQIKDSVAKAVRERIKNLPATDDFPIFKNGPSGRALAMKVLEEQRLASTIVVIDNKIFSLDSKEYLRLTKDSVIGAPILIHDENSPFTIKSIMIFTTKGKH